MVQEYLKMSTRAALEIAKLDRLLQGIWETAKGGEPQDGLGGRTDLWDVWDVWGRVGTCAGDVWDDKLTPPRYSSRP